MKKKSTLEDFRTNVLDISKEKSDGFHFLPILLMITLVMIGRDLIPSALFSQSDLLITTLDSDSNPATCEKPISKSLHALQALQARFS